MKALKISRGRLLTLLLAVAVLPAATAHADALDDLIKREIPARHIAGVSVAVVKDGKVLKAKGYGLASVELAVPATPETVYQLASVTKQFTATAVMQLVEQDKLKLDDAVSKYLPDLPEAWRPVTIQQLLTHTSGIKSYTSVEGFERLTRKDFTHDEILKLVADAPLEFPPGTQHNYSNTGYFLLGMLIEKVSGKPWDVYLRESIFEPLGMKDTRRNDLSVILPRRAPGYQWGPDGMKNGEYVSPTQPYAAGALVSTVRDLAKWDAALYGEKVLKRATLEQMWKPVTLADGKTAPYGFGWETDTYRGCRRVHHGGGIPGFSTDITRFPDEKLTVIVLSNSETANSSQLATHIATLYSPTLKKNAPRPIADNDTQTTGHLRRVMVALIADEADADWFAEAARKRLFPDRAREVAAFLRQNGTLASFELMEDVPTSASAPRQRGYRVTIGKTQLRATFVLDKDGKIAGLGLRPEE